MGYITRPYDDIHKMSEYLELLRKEGYNRNVLEVMLNYVVPYNENYKVDVMFSNSDVPAFFDADNNKIQISPESLKKYIYKIINPVSNIDREELFRYFVIFVLVHEVEHFYQYLIGECYIDFPYKIVRDAYKNLFTLKIGKDVNFIHALILINHFVKQKCNPLFLFERNANVEAYEILCNIAKNENNKGLEEFFNKQKLHYLTIGYRGRYNGSIQESYNKVWLGSLYEYFSKDEIVPIEDRVRYGLTIDRETRKKVLRKEYKI